MDILENKNKDFIELQVSGRLDTTTAPELELKVKDCAKKTKHLVLNLSSVEYISSAGLRVVLQAHKIMTSNLAKMSIRNPSEFCCQVFEATGMDSILSIVNA